MLKKPDLSQLEPLYDKKIECPFCHNLFTSKKVRSRFVKPIKAESDFGPIYKKDDRNNPLYYYVTVCPHCGFSFTEDFSHLIGQAARNKVQTEITAKMDKMTDFCGERSIEQAVRAYKLAIYAGQLVKEKHIVFANLCLRLAWLQRNAANKDEERRFLQLAASEYEQSYMHSDFNTETTPEMSILYLIGELSRRLGKFNEAIKYFTKVLEHPDRSRYMKYTTLARQQWKAAVDEYRENKE